MSAEPTSIAPRPRPIPIDWRDQTGSLTVVFFRQDAAPVRICGAAARFQRRGFGTEWRGFCALGASALGRRRRSVVGFTLLELLVVVAIIGLMAGLTLPHLRGFSKSNSMSAATRQMLDDVSYARQRAIANRSIVYMVFVPPAPWTYISQQTWSTLPGRTLTNLVNSVYRGYALISVRTVGDQPGRWHPSYLTDWKTLPSGAFIAQNQFANAQYANNNNTFSNFYPVWTSNTLSGTYNKYFVYTFPNNSSAHPIPFPTLQTSSWGLPYIAFSPNGGLVDENGAPVPDQFIALTSGGILYPTDANGFPTFVAPLVTENPPGEWTNNANLIHIDATTGRARLERNQF